MKRKKLLIIALIMLLLAMISGCESASDKEYINNYNQAAALVQKSYFNGYDKITIKNALEAYFGDCSWNTFGSEDDPVPDKDVFYVTFLGYLRDENGNAIQNSNYLTLISFKVNMSTKSFDISSWINANKELNSNEVNMAVGSIVNYVTNLY